LKSEDFCCRFSKLRQLEYERWFSNTFITNEICIIAASRYSFAPSSFILLIKKGRGNGPVKPWQPSGNGKVPTPIPNVRKEISRIPAQNIFIILKSSSDLIRRAFFISSESPVKEKHAVVAYLTIN